MSTDETPAERLRMAAQVALAVADALLAGRA